jgi:RNA polymerase sigma-70 factor (ECF subfamily)
MELYGPLIYSRCRKANIPAQDVADVGQEVFLEVMKSIGGFRRDRPGDTFRGWVARITQRRIADYWRQRQRSAEGEAPGGSVARAQLGEVPDHHARQSLSGSIPPQQQSISVMLSEEADTEEAETLRRRALELVASRFEPRTWRACCLVVLKGQPVEVVAQELGMSENAVRVAKSRVLDCLREEFGELLGDLPD